MATKRLSMRQTREILRQKFLLGRSHREIAGSLGLSVGAVGMAVSRARVAGVDWPQVETLADDALDARLYRRAPLPTGERPVPDCVYLHIELRKPGVTLQLLHEEYVGAYPRAGQDLVGDLIGALRPRHSDYLGLNTGAQLSPGRFVRRTRLDPSTFVR